jgi:hypothetical protein
MVTLPEGVTVASHTTQPLGHQPIADKVIYPGLHGAQGTSIWFDWTPQTAAEHHLFAVLREEKNRGSWPEG